MKKITAMILVFSILAGLALAFPASAATANSYNPQPDWNGSSAEKPSGSGTKEDPYLVSSAEHLKWFSDLTANGSQRFFCVGYNGKVWSPTYDSTSESLYETYLLTKTYDSSSLDAFLAHPNKTVDLAQFASKPYIYVKQTADIDLNGQSLRSIGSYWVPSSQC